MSATTYQRAFLESTLGHAAVALLAVAILFLSQCMRPVEPAEEFVAVAILAGPASDGELGAPSPDAKTDQDKNEAAAAPVQQKAPPPPPPPPEVVKTPDVPPIREPEDVKIPEVPKPDDKPKVEDKPKVADKPKPEDKPKPPETKPERHQVRVQTNKVIVAQNKPSESKDKKTTKASTQLSKAQIDALLTSGLNLSKGGGAGWGGGPPGSIARGTPSSLLNMYKATLKAKLYNAWMRPPGVEGLMTTIRITIVRNGTIVSSQITRRSGHPAMDESALQAVRSVKPGPLPEGVDAPYTLDVEFDASGVSV